MTMGIAEQSAAVIDRRVRPTHQYYRQPNGWITGSVATAIEEMQYINHGWTALKTYGGFDMGSPYMANNPFEPLFMRGGAKELPLQQIIDNGFHHTPPMVPTCGQVLTQYHKNHDASCWQGARPVQFPQLEGKSIPGPFACRFCDAVRNTEAGRTQHEQIVHKTEKNAITSGEVLAAAMAQGLQGLVVGHQTIENPVRKQRRAKMTRAAKPATPSEEA